MRCILSSDKSLITGFFSRMQVLRIALIALVICAVAPADARQRDSRELCLPLAASTPEAVGLSATRLKAMSEHFRHEVKINSAAGYVFMVARDGKLAYSSAVGLRNIEQHVPMTLDTRFRIASMSKPITSVAVLMLYEEGRFQLDDSVSRFLPEFANPRIYTGVDLSGHLTSQPTKRGITIRDLLTHTSGLGYGGLFDPESPLRDAYEGLKLTAVGTSLADKVRGIANLPLYFQPGSDWRYSYADDVLGRLVEVVSGQPFEKFLKIRLFDPLAMSATGFYIPSSIKPLLATMYKHDPDGNLQESHPTWLWDVSDTTMAPSGGGGLISTASDYLRFAQMLANGGSFAGRQYLSPVTVALMTENQVAEDAMVKYWGANSQGLGYGLGVGVDFDAHRAPHAGFAGDYSWGGIFDTHWLVSPKAGIVAVLLTQVDPSGNKTPQRTDTDFRNLLFASLTRLDAQGSSRFQSEPVGCKDLRKSH